MVLVSLGDDNANSQSLTKQWLTLASHFHPVNCIGIVKMAFKLKHIQFYFSVNITKPCCEFSSHPSIPICMSESVYTLTSGQREALADSWLFLFYLAGLIQCVRTCRCLYVCVVCWLSIKPVQNCLLCLSGSYRLDSLDTQRSVTLTHSDDTKDNRLSNSNTTPKT